jgi:hypothetical protein
MNRLIRLGLIVLALAGCSSSTAPPPPTHQQTGFPANDTPQHAVQRLVAAYEHKARAEYQGVFTGDFTYEFSNSTDPALVQQYSTGWFKIDEKESSNHLFSGFTPPGGYPLAAASAIHVSFASTLPSDDNTSNDPVTHKVLLTRVDGEVDVPQTGSEPLTYLISNNLNELHLVRGDAAAGLDSTQAADSTRWYIYRWVDLTSGTPSPARSPLATQPATWGKLKGLYHP